MEDGDTTLAEDCNRDGAQVERLPFVARFGVDVDVAVAIGDLVERKELLRGGTGRSTDARVQAELGTVSHCLFSFHPAQNGGPGFVSIHRVAQSDGSVSPAFRLPVRIYVEGVDFVVARS
jgi:hypothetical protein